MSLYVKQARYFRDAYRRGEHGWPVEGPEPRIAAALRRLARRQPGGMVLDLGCGEGRHAFDAAERGFRVIGVDAEPLAIKRARALAVKHPGVVGRVAFQVADLFALPYRPSTFDVIIDYGCFHHVMRADTRRYLEGVLPLLKPGGYFLLSCFSTRFKHYPGERRTRDWVVHRGHYDRFFRKRDFASIFGDWCDVQAIQEERDGLSGFYHVTMRRKDAEHRGVERSTDAVVKGDGLRRGSGVHVR
jgi:SAM-dependent methyltransferase